MAYRFLAKTGAYGGWDVDAFFRDIPESKWEELKIAQYLIAHQEAWPDSEKWEKPAKKPWNPPNFEDKKPKGRRRLSGSVY